MSKLMRFFAILFLVLSLFAASSAPVLAQDLPDLQPTGIVVTTLYTNVTNAVTVNIANNTNVAANNFAVKLQADGTDLATKTGNSILGNHDPNYYPISVKFNWKPTATGNPTLTAIVNPGPSPIPESDLTNNQIQQSVTVINLTPITVKVRIEGKTATIWSGQVTFSTSTITDKQGKTTTVDHPTALGALNQASKVGGVSYVVSSAYGLLGYVESVGGDAAQGLDGWLYRVNWQSPPVAAVDYTLAANDEILWYYGGWAAQPLKLTVDKTSLLPTDNFTATVESFDGTAWNAVQDATVHAESHIFTTDANGQVSNISLPPGGYNVYADKDTYDTYIRSNTQKVVVYVPLDLQPGWNFISVPKRLAGDNSTTQELFGSVNTAGHSIFKYNPASTNGWGVMGANDTISPLDGIWIYSAAPIELQPVFDPNPQQVPPTKQLSAGWNAIGFTDFTQAAANSALSSVASGWSTLIGFNATTQTYDTSIIKNAPATDPHSEAGLMYPWKGYWLFMTSDGELAAISS